MSNHIQVSSESGVVTLTLDRPEKRNALRRDTIEAMLEAVQSVSNNGSVRVFVLRATGKVFCAGMDLSQMQERATAHDSQDQWQRDSQVYGQLLECIYSLQIPTVAVVQGPALAGGMGLLLACDIVIAAETAFFMLPEPIRGITAAMVTPFLIQRMGTGPATYLLLSNERMSASQSRFFGLCHDVVPEIALDERADHLIDSILSGSPMALAITKRHIADCASSRLPELLRRSIYISAQSRETEDAREGLDAFLEKRKPNWQTDE